MRIPFSVEIHGQGRETSVFSSVITNYCPWCRSTFFPWPISPPIDELHDHSVAVHLPKPSPVSLPIASVAKSFSVSIDAGSARGYNAGSGGCPDGGRCEETQTDSAQVGRWRTWFSNANQGDGSRSARRHGCPRGLEKEARRLLQQHHTGDGYHIIKQCLRTDQETRSLRGAIFDTVIMATEHDVVKSTREQTRRYNGVQAASKGHTLGPPQILIAGLQKQGAAVGAANAATLADYTGNSSTIRAWTRSATMRGSARSIGRTNPSKLASLWRSTSQAYETPVVSALQQLGAACMYGRAPPTQLSRELQQWVDTLLDK